MGWQWYVLFFTFFIIDVWKEDPKKFIFTLKNPYGVEPTRYMKKRNRKHAILCDPSCGPLFGYDRWVAIHISDHCFRDNSCYINCDENDYIRHIFTRLVVFLYAPERGHENCFSVSDYEVFCIDNYKDYVYKTFNYPDIIWKYIETQNISEESLYHVNNSIALLNDLDVAHCNDSSILLMISRYFFKNPSQFLPDTQLVDSHYDSYLREWLGSDYKWKLLYRASEHGYTSESFHNYCNDKGPTLIVIKSSGGWIFGGYTTESWSGYGIYNMLILVINRCKQR